MDEKTLKLAYTTPVLAAVIQSKGCSNLDECIEITLSLISKLENSI